MVTLSNALAPRMVFSTLQPLISCFSELGVCTAVRGGFKAEGFECKGGKKKGGKRHH